MSALRIARATTVLSSPVPIAAERLAAWEAGFANQDGEALARRWVRDDEWLLIRQLRLQTRWRADEADIEVGRAWASAFERAIAQAVAQARDGDEGNCVHYRHRREALADMVYRSALRDVARQWAWQRIGLVPRPGLPPEEALGCALREIEREPELAWPVLMRLLQAEPATAAFTAALRALGGTAVLRLLRTSPRSAPYLSLRDEPREPGRVADAGTSAPPDPVWPTAAQDLIRWARSRAAWAQRHRETLAALLAAIAWSGCGATAPSLRRWLDRARAEIDLNRAARAALGPVPLPAPAAAAPADEAESAAACDAPAANPAAPTAGAAGTAAVAMPPELTASGTERSTHWGGALFWLTRLGAAWSGLEPRPELALLLRETALALGVPADDAALAAFCGGEVPLGEAASAATEAAATARDLVAGWEAWLRDAAPELPQPRIPGVCRREGRLAIDAGWIELHLPLRTVDTTVRRLGLDLDPGWLPWLGCVVRIVYDDA